MLSTVACTCMVDIDYELRGFWSLSNEAIVSVTTTWVVDVVNAQKIVSALALPMLTHSSSCVSRHGLCTLRCVCVSGGVWGGPPACAGALSVELCCV